MRIMNLRLRLHYLWLWLTSTIRYYLRKPRRDLAAMLTLLATLWVISYVLYMVNLFYEASSYILIIGTVLMILLALIFRV